MVEAYMDQLYMAEGVSPEVGSESEGGVSPISYASEKPFSSSGTCPHPRVEARQSQESTL